MLRNSHHSGQMCSAGSRIYVQEGVYDEFVKRLTVVAESIRFGDGFDPATQCGPVISELQFQVRTVQLGVLYLTYASTSVL